MSEYSKADALAFVDAMRLTLGDKVGFKWLAEKLTDLATYIESIAAENERLNAYLNWANAREDFESYQAMHPDAGSGSSSEGAQTGDQGVIEIHYGENLGILRTLPEGSARLIYIDPPFNSRKTQARTRTRKVRDDEGEHVGFYGARYSTRRLGTMSFADSFDEFCEFLEPRLVEAKRVLADDGSFFLHLDYRECHYAKVLCDTIFGRDSFKNEIIWAYDYGGRPKNRWPAKHDTILWYAADPSEYVYRYDDIDRIPYMAPGLVTPEKAARGKSPTDVWWHTIVTTNGRERTGYPTQKPLGILRRIVAVHSDPGDLVLDFFAGSGTTGEAAALLGRDAVLVDDSPDAMRVMAARLQRWEPAFMNWPVNDG